MAGQKPGIASWLTEKSGNLLDWHNVGGLASQRTRDGLMGLWNHYSWREYIIRGSIGVAALLLTIYGYKEGKPQGNQVKLALAYGTAGFFVTHTIAVIPTIQRRYEITKQTVALHLEINTQLVQLVSQNKLANVEPMQTKITEIKEFSFPTLARGDAVKNLVRTKQLLRDILHKLQHDDYDEELWKLPAKEIIEKLEAERANSRSAMQLSN